MSSSPPISAKEITLTKNITPDMFRALSKSHLSKDQVFSVTVGASSKRTLASWHLLAPSDVIASIAALNRPRYDEGTAAQQNGRAAS